MLRYIAGNTLCGRSLGCLGTLEVCRFEYAALMQHTLTHDINALHICKWTIKAQPTKALYTRAEYRARSASLIKLGQQSASVENQQLTSSRSALSANGHPLVRTQKLSGGDHFTNVRSLVQQL